MISYPSIIPDPSLQKKWLHVCYKPPPVERMLTKNIARVANAIPPFWKSVMVLSLFLVSSCPHMTLIKCLFWGCFLNVFLFFGVFFLSLPFLLVKPLNFCLVIISIVVYIATKYANAMCIYDVH